MPEDIYEDWFNGIFTKTVCEARNRNHLMKAAALAKEQGLKEGVDFVHCRMMRRTQSAGNISCTGEPEVFMGFEYSNNPL